MDTINDALKRIRKGESAFLLGLDYSVSLKHKIKTKNQIISDKRKFDPITFDIEYCNRMIRENTSAYFTYKMFLDNQRCRKPFYPRKTIDVISKRKNPYSIPKQDGEIRVVSCDLKQKSPYIVICMINYSLNCWKAVKLYALQRRYEI